MVEPTNIADQDSLVMSFMKIIESKSYPLLHSNYHFDVGETCFLAVETSCLKRISCKNVWDVVHIIDHFPDHFGFLRC